MKTFVVAYLSLEENELKQELVTAESVEEAMLMSSFVKSYVFLNLDESHIKNVVADNDAFISAMEVKLCSCPME